MGELKKKKVKADVCVRISTYFSETLWNTYGSAQAHIFSFEVR